MITVHRDMARSRSLPIILILALLRQSFSVPIDVARIPRGLNDNELESNETTVDSVTLPTSTEDEPSKIDLPDITTEAKVSIATPDPVEEDDDDDDGFGEPQPANAGGGSNVFSILRLAGALFPTSSNSGANPRIRKLIQDLTARYQARLKAHRRSDIDNEIDVDNSDSSSSTSHEDQDTEEDISNDTEEDISDDNNKSKEISADENSAAEESREEPAKDNGSKPKQDSDASIDESDYDEPPGGDGNGGGILGILAGLSGGGDGSDLGTLLATVSGIVANLSGDGVDVNALIASGIGLFVGLLSEGNENPGSILASYLLTSLETLTGGGAQNNGQFFGTFLSKLLKGTSAVIDPDASSEENNGVKMTDSAGFFISFIMGLLGDMSKGSSGSSSHPEPRIFLLDR